jgi:hypothetical protein
MNTESTTLETVVSFRVPALVEETISALAKRVVEECGRTIQNAIRMRRQKMTWAPSSSPNAA